MKKIAFAAAFAAMMSPAYAETKPEDGKKTEATKVETTKAETEKAEEKKKELTPEEKAAKAEKEAKLAEEKAKLMGAGEPRALILDILGFSEPKIDSFDELNDGANILLEAKAEIALTYYPTCEDLTIRGGRITISGEKMTLDNGELVSRTKGVCPGNVKLSPADVVNASVVTRSIRTKPIISTAPKRIGIAGPGAAKYTNIGVYGPDGAVFEAKLEGRGAAWPKDAGTLEPGKQYTIVLTGPEVQMFAARVVPDETASPVTVFRIQ